MQKTANRVLLMLIFLFFTMRPFVNSSSIPQELRIEREMDTYAKMLVYQEIDRQKAVEKQMYDELISKPSMRFLFTGFTEAQIMVESSGNQNAISPEGAQGIAQFLPSTWEALKRNKLIPEWFSIDNESHQRLAQLIYLDYLYNKWITHPTTERKALMAASYNAGIGRVKNLVKTYGSEWRNYLPDETINYLNVLKKFV